MNNRKPYEDLANLYFNKVLLREEVDLRGQIIDFTYFPHLFNHAVKNGMGVKSVQVPNATAKEIYNAFSPLAETDVHVKKELARLSHYLNPVDMSKPEEPPINDEEFDDEGIDDEGIDDEDALGIDDTAPIR